MTSASGPRPAAAPPPIGEALTVAVDVFNGVLVTLPLAALGLAYAYEKALRPVA